MGFLAARRRRRGPHRFRCLPLVDTQALGAHSALDAEHEQAHPAPGGRHGAAILTVANPKVLFICAAAGLAIGTAGLGSTGVWIAEIWYVVVAASTVAIPILAYAVSGDRLDPPLTRLKDWMERQHATLVAAILVVIGLLVLYKGIHGL